MRRIIDQARRIARRTDVRIGAAVVAALACSLAFWPRRASPQAPKSPTKQIQTGVAMHAPATVQPAVAALSDDQLPVTSGGAFRPTQLQRVSDATPTTQAPQVNPYLPTTGDAASGYNPSQVAASQYAGSSQFATNAEPPQPAAVPSDPTAFAPRAAAPQPAEQTDAAPSAGISPPSLSPLNQSPYAAAVTAPAPASAEPYTPQPPPPSTPTYIETPASAAPPVNRLPSFDSSAAAQVNPYSASLSSSRDQLPVRSERSGPKLLAAATPGERSLEGTQQPSVSLEKVSPSEIQVGKVATFALYVRNSGKVAAQNVTVTDHVPAGTQLIDAKPQVQQSADGSLVWNLGTMQPGDETQITLQVMPQTEGEIGSTAHVSFSAAATSRSISTRPQLAIEHTAPPKVLIGEGMTASITVSNPGTGPATGVIIEEDVPPGLIHVGGSQLEYEVGTLRPGESKHLELSLKAERAGLVQNCIRVRADGGLTAQHVAQIEVIAPQLQLAVEGPKRRFLERPATYTLQVANPGTATARDIELAALLPRGMRFVSTDAQGQYDSAQHAVFWSLAELQPGQSGAVKLALTPVEPGEQRIQVEGRASLDLTARAEQPVAIEQAAELVHTVKDLDEVIEVGSDTTYEIRVKNSGTKAATNVRVAALMPPGMAAVSGDGPTKAGGDATQIAFAPLERLNPREEVVYRVQAQGKQPGDHIVRVQLSADDVTAVTREESTRVYQDR